jgi:hypothetical protein
MTAVNVKFQLSQRFMDYIPAEIGRVLLAFCVDVVEMRLPVFPNVSSDFGAYIGGNVGKYSFSKGTLF